MEYNADKREIKSDKLLSELDKIVLRFTKILEKHFKYVIISGYVSILLGRSRATEDIDLFIEKVNKESFHNFYNELKEDNLECLNAEDETEILRYLSEGLSIRFSEKGMPMPNFEIKLPKKQIEKDTFTDFLIVKLNDKNLNISSLERHIAFKRYYLGTKKDIEDSHHIEETFNNKIDYKKVEELKKIIEKIKQDERRKTG